MAFPLIPILALFGLVGSGATLVWYENLSTEQKDRADRMAAGYARSLFNKTMDQLTAAEAQDVHDRVSKYFN